MTWQFFILLMWCFSFVRNQYEPYGENVAYRKPANQSTTLAAFNASLGVDGTISTDVDAGTCSVTGEGPRYAWWTVDLDGFYFIKFIMIYQWSKYNWLRGSQMYAKETDTTWKQINFDSKWPPSVFNVSVELNKPIGEIMLNTSFVQGAAAFICVCELQAFKVIECVPVSFANGSFEVITYGDSHQTFTFGTKFKVTCHEGYRMSDDGTLANETESTLECNATGNWSRNLACLAIDCGRPLNIPVNSTIVFSTGLAGDTSYNATFTIQCSKGFRYTHPGNETSRCGSEGHWTDYPGLCEALHGMNASEDENKTCLIAWTITGPLCLILLVTNIATCIRFHRHTGFNKEKRNNVPDDLTTAYNLNARDRRLQAKEDNSTYNFVEDSNTDTLNSKGNTSEHNAMELYDNLQKENREKSEYDKLTFEKESSLKTTIKKK